MELKFTTTTCHLRPITVPWSPQTNMASPYNIRDKSVPAHFCHIVKKKINPKPASEDLGFDFLQRLSSRSTLSGYSAKSASIPVKKASTCSTINRHHFAPTSNPKPYLGLYDPDQVINTIVGSSTNAIPKNRLLHCAGGSVYPSPEIRPSLQERPTLKVDLTSPRLRPPEHESYKLLRFGLGSAQMSGVANQPVRPTLRRAISSPYPAQKLANLDKLERTASQPISVVNVQVNPLPNSPMQQSYESPNKESMSEHKEHSAHKSCLPKYRTQGEVLPTTSAQPEKRPADGILQPPKKRVYHEPPETECEQAKDDQEKNRKPAQEGRLRVKTNLCKEKPISNPIKDSFTNPLEIRIEVSQNSVPKVIFEKPVQIQSLMKRTKSHGTELVRATKSPVYSAKIIPTERIREPFIGHGAEQKAVVNREKAEKLRKTLLSVMHVLLGPKRMEALGYPNKSTDEMLIEVLYLADLSPKLGISYSHLRENVKLFLSLLVLDKKEAEKRGWEGLDAEDVLEEIYIRDVLPHLESVSRTERY